MSGGTLNPTHSHTHQGHTAPQAISALITADNSRGAAREAGEKSRGATRLVYYCAVNV